MIGPADAAPRRQARGRWREGQEQGAVARTAATRLLAELAGRPELHALLAQSGAAAALAAQGAALVRALELASRLCSLVLKSRETAEDAAGWPHAHVAAEAGLFSLYRGSLGAALDLGRPPHARSGVCVRVHNRRAGGHVLAAAGGREHGRGMRMRLKKRQA